jgi:predicted phage terminase large subunit-like protein
MIFAPPRHGKSRLASEVFPAWCLGLDPSEQFMVCSHRQELSDTFSRNVRNVLGLDAYHELFPATRLSADSATIQKWTLAGFGRPAMLSVGVGAAPTGQGAKVLIIDDPVGDAEQAESEVYRERLWRWYTDTIYPRLEPNAAIVVMMQRWHEDDLAGRLLRAQDRADQWVQVSLPALAEADDPLGRDPGRALWPMRFGEEALASIRAVNPRSFDAKYQQRPRPAEGALFKRGWLRVVDAGEVSRTLRWVRYYDLAYSLRESADYTATISGAFDTATGTLYLRRGRAGRMETPDVRKMIYDLIMAEPAVRHGIENKVHGGPVVQDLLRAGPLVARAVSAVNVESDKYVRAVVVADRAAAGKVAFVRESPNDDGWIDDWIAEMTAFPYGEHDDRVDAVSGVAQMLAALPTSAPPQPGRQVGGLIGLG